MRSIIVGIVMMISAGSVTAQDQRPLNVEEWQSAVQILQAAKTAIEEKGWQQGATEPTEARCLATAMEDAWLGERKSLVDFEYAKLALDQALDAPDASSLTSTNDPLAVPYWGRYYMYWNDAKGRTEEQVLAALDKAIAYAEGRKQESSELRRSGSDVESFDREMMRSLGFADP